MSKEMEDWVLIEAAKRGNFNREIESLQHTYENTPLFRALCDMILKHEQQPVDRKLLCAEEAARFWATGVGVTGKDACLHAIELYERGFGK